MTSTILSKYDPSTAELGGQLTGFLLSQLPGSVELPDESSGIIAITYGKGYKDIICTVIPSKQGIKLGFNRGSELPDPEHLLTGKGKLHKYVVIRSALDFEKPGILSLLREGLKAYDKRK
ncbi:MAG: hypothetical protein NTY96_11040 [Bacteroidetes bacterium]|nr:hypothetical protein [Bacteroidota bacterium]